MAHKWNEVSIAALTNSAYTIEEFREAIWTDKVSKACAEPFRYHIDMWSFIANEFIEGIVPLYREDGKWMELDKHEILNIEEATPVEAYFIYLPDLEHYIKGEADDWDIDYMDEFISSGGWKEILEKRPDYISDAHYEMLEWRVEMYIEQQGDIARGK